MDPRALLRWLSERPGIVTTRAVLDLYGRAAGGLLANGLAFSALFAAIPTTLLVLGMAGWAASGDPIIQEQVTDALVHAFPPLAELIRGAVDAITDGAQLTSVIGLIGLIWTVSQFFGAVDTAFARIYAGERERDALWRTVRGVLIVGVLATIVVAVIVVLGVAATFDAAGGQVDGPAGLAVRILGSPAFLVFAASVAVVIAYRFLPPDPPSWRALILPAVVVAVILVVFSQVFTFLVPRLVGIAALAGPLASGFAALAWLSFSFQTLLLGTTWVRVRDEGRGSASLQRPAAPAEPGVGGE